eukprot:Colp12_sorted_trinity150504_noHs@8098
MIPPAPPPALPPYLNPPAAEDLPRNALLADICKGKRLRKVETVDKSAPLISTNTVKKESTPTNNVTPSASETASMPVQQAPANPPFGDLASMLGSVKLRKTSESNLYLRESAPVYKPEEKTAVVTASASTSSNSEIEKKPEIAVAPIEAPPAPVVEEPAPIAPVAEAVDDAPALRKRAQSMSAVTGAIAAAAVARGEQPSAASGATVSRRHSATGASRPAPPPPPSQRRRSVRSIDFTEETVEPQHEQHETQAEATQTGVETETLTQPSLSASMIERTHSTKSMHDVMDGTGLADSSIKKFIVPELVLEAGFELEKRQVNERLSALKGLLKPQRLFHKQRIHAVNKMNDQHRWAEETLQLAQEREEKARMVEFKRAHKEGVEAQRKKVLNPMTKEEIKADKLAYRSMLKEEFAVDIERLRHGQKIESLVQELGYLEQQHQMERQHLYEIQARDTTLLTEQFTHEARLLQDQQKHSLKAAVKEFDKKLKDDMKARKKQKQPLSTEEIDLARAVFDDEQRTQQQQQRDEMDTKQRVKMDNVVKLHKQNESALHAYYINAVNHTKSKLAALVGGTNGSQHISVE